MKIYDYWCDLCKTHGTTISKACATVTGSSANLVTWKKGYMRSDLLCKFADLLNLSTDELLMREQNIFTKNLQIDHVGSLNGRPVKPMITHTLYENKNFEKKPPIYDDLTIKMIERFQLLDFDDKIKILNDVICLTHV